MLLHGRGWGCAPVVGVTVTPSPPPLIDWKGFNIGQRRRTQRANRGAALNGVELEALDRLVDAMDADSPPDAIRQLAPSAFQGQRTRREGAPCPMLAAHGVGAAVAAADKRVQYLRNDATWEAVPEGSLWSADPGVQVDLSAIDPSLPVPELRTVRGGLTRALGAERDAWAHPYKGVRGAVEGLAARARAARASALVAALREDAIDGVVLGWRSPEDAKRALGVDNLHPGPGRRHPAPLPVAVAIGCGENAVEAHRSAQAAGHDQEVRDAAQVLMAPVTACDIVRRRLPLDGLVDFHALAENVRRGGD